MPDTLRAFNQAGLKKWADFVDSLKLDPSANFPEEWLVSPEFTTTQAESLDLTSISLPKCDEPNKLEFSRALLPIFQQLMADRVDHNLWPNIWDWLSAKYFHILCPKHANGKRKPKQRDWYVFSVKYNRQYKHRIAGPLKLLNAHGDNIDFLLLSTSQSRVPSSLSQLEDEIASRQDIASSAEALAALRKLYWDAENQQQRRGSVSNSMKPGSIRRFAALFEQLERTFDVAQIGSSAILELLPQREFERWTKHLTA